jgi:hypothetical protein
MAVYAVLFISLLVISGNITYFKEIIRGSVIPTKSSWIIFSLVTGLNVSTLLITKFDLVGGAYSITDFIVCSATLFITFLYSKKEKAHFQSFEKYYLIGALACVLFWIISRNSFTTNLLVQALTVVGYIPMIHNILLAKKSSESKLAWTIWTVGALLSIYPAVAKENTLAIVYALRATVMCLTILCLTYKFQKNNRNYKTEKEENMETKQFHIGDVLSVILDQKVSPRGLEGMQDLLNFMTDDYLHNLQWERTIKECKPHLLLQFPQFDTPQMDFARAELRLMLESLTGKERSRHLVLGWLSKLTSGKYGIKCEEMLTVKPLPKGVHQFTDPIAEVKEKIDHVLLNK